MGPSFHYVLKLQRCQQQYLTQRMPLRLYTHAHMHTRIKRTGAYTYPYPHSCVHTHNKNRASNCTRLHTETHVIKQSGIRIHTQTNTYGCNVCLSLYYPPPPPPHTHTHPPTDLGKR